MPDFKLDDILQMTKVYSYLKGKNEDEKMKKAVRIILICVGAAAILAAGLYVLYRIFNRYDDDYDLYDDLDYYFDEDEEDSNEDEYEEDEEDEEEGGGEEQAD